MKVESGLMRVFFLLVALVQLCSSFVVSPGSTASIIQARVPNTLLSVATSVEVPPPTTTATISMENAIATATSNTDLTQAELSKKWDQIKAALPADMYVPGVGGWYYLQTMHATVADPKAALVKLLVDGINDQTNDKNKVQFSTNDETLNALVILLYASGKGFESDVVEGDWSLVFSKQGRKSPKFQKAVGAKERAGLTLNTFDTKSMTFSGDVSILKKGTLGSTVKYTPMSEGYSKTAAGNKIVLRRIGCDIIGASWKFWFFPKVPLPLRVKGGYLEFVYMDKDIRITKGNRGGLFIHFRPEFLTQQLSS